MPQEEKNLFNQPHRRLNLLTNEWIQVSPHRTQRPWQGKREDTPQNERPQYDETCYLCPGNARAGGKEKNPKYESTFVFENDFSALLLDTPVNTINVDNLLISKSEKGICKVICFSPRHDLTLPEMTVNEILNVVNVWEQQYNELGAREEINYVQIFENKGELMGCSNPHPHGQIWAQATIPEEPAKELIQQKSYYKKYGRTLLSDYLSKEFEQEERIVAENEHFVVLVPFWAFWPYETIVISRRPFARLTDMSNEEKKGLLILSAKSLFGTIIYLTFLFLIRLDYIRRRLMV